jgi:HK97 family phage major capsid protein
MKKIVELRRKLKGVRDDRDFTVTEAQKLNEVAGNTTKVDELIKRAELLQTEMDGLQVEIEREERIDALGAERAAEKPKSFIGMPEKDLRNYRLTRAISALIRRDWTGAELEQEASQAVAQQLRREPNGFFVPFDVQEQRFEQRDLDTTTGAGAKSTTFMGGSLIDALRNALVLRRAGATFMTGLVGTVQIPKVTSKHQWYWVGEGLAPTESNIAVGQVELTPKTIGAWQEFTRQLLAQTSLDIEMLVRNDIGMMLAEGLDYTALHGDSNANANSPDGLVNIANVATPSGGLAWAGVVNLETEVQVANAAGANMAYVTNAKVRGKLKQTAKVTNTDSVFVWGDEELLNGYPALVSNIVEDNAGVGNDESYLWFGNWPMLLIGAWGTIDILVDPYSQSTTGKTRVIGFMEADIDVRHAQGFGYVTGATA